MFIDNFFTTRILANLFGLKGFERDIFFALSYTENRNNKRYVKYPTVYKVRSNRQKQVPLPICAFESVEEIKRLITPKTEMHEMTDSERIRSASVADFKNVLREVAKKRLENNISNQS